MMSFFLPPRPNYEQLRKQAKELYKACLAGDAAAVKRMCAPTRASPRLAMRLPPR